MRPSWQHGAAVLAGFDYKRGYYVRYDPDGFPPIVVITSGWEESHEIQAKIREGLAKHGSPHFLYQGILSEQSNNQGPVLERKVLGPVQAGAGQGGGAGWHV